MITVPQVFASLGITPSNSLSWAVGSRIATMYANEYGTQPPKDNRPKTRGGGSHCFALYPASWEQRIRRVILACEESERTQGDLFEGQHEPAP